MWKGAGEPTKTCVTGWEPSQSLSKANLMATICTFRGQDLPSLRTEILRVSTTKDEKSKATCCIEQAASGLLGPASPCQGTGRGVQTQGALVPAILPGRSNQVLWRLWPAPWLFEFSGLAVQLRPDLKGLQAAGNHEFAHSLICHFQILNEGKEVL